MAELTPQEQARLEFLRQKVQNSQRNIPNVEYTPEERQSIGDPASFRQKVSNFLDKSGELALGAGQSAVGAFTAPGRAVQKILPQTRGGQQVTSALEQATTPQNKLQQTGKNIFDVAQIVTPLPGGKQQAATKATGFLGKLLGKVGQTSRNLLSETTRDVATSIAQGDRTAGQIGSDVAVGTAVGVALPRVLQSVADFTKYLKRAPVADTAEGVLDVAIREVSPEAAIRQTAEAEAKNIPLSIPDRLIGLTPDLKQTLAKAGPKKTQRYVDVVMARNQGATLADGTPIPSATSYGAERVYQTQQKVENVLNDTGSEIGKFRNKVATVEVPRDSVTGLKNTIDSQLGKLNLRIQDGQVTQVKGSIKKAKSGDIKAIKELYDNYKIFSQSPTIENLIDLRSVFDSNIKFGKRVNDVSSDLDPLSRAIRSEIASINRSVIGKEQANLLQKYSDTIDALQELRSYTERRAGSEFLLKRVLSERDREVRQLLKTIEDITGDDLLEDATLVKVTTDLLGNSQQKGLFRQEITNAGGDLVKILGGDKVGVISSIIDKGSRALLNEEDIIIRAAQGK